MANKLDTLEDLDAPSRPEWRKWLAAHHTQPEGVWLILYKKESGQRQMAYADAVEEALCFSWIDSLPRKIDAARYKLLFSPRKKGNVWSALNKRRVAQLEAAGLLMPAGRAKIEAAQQDGSWNLLNSSDALEMPTDLGQTLATNAVAQQNFAAFSESSRKQILQYVANAKRPETRQKRIAQTVELAAQNQKPNQ